MLLPIVGKTIFIVDLVLKYPSGELTAFGMELDKERSLPGLPIAKSKDFLYSKSEEQIAFPTQIIKKKIFVYVDKNIAPQKENFIIQNVTDWFNIDDTKGDILEIRKVLDMSERLEVEVNFFEDPIFILLVLLFLVSLILVVIFNSKIRKLTNSMKNINIAGFDKAIQALSNLQNYRCDTNNPLKNSDCFPREPLPIRIVESNESEDKDDSIDFHFLENLSINDFVQLLKDERAGTLAVVLPNLSSEYANKFFIEYNEDYNIILKDMFTSSQKTKEEIKQIRNVLYKKYRNFIANKKVTFENRENLISIINHLPPQKATMLFEQTKNINSEIAEEIRDQIFFFEDILKLDDTAIGKIILEVEHNILVSFLASIGNEVQKKFFQNVSERATLIIKEDKDVLGSLSQQEQEKAKNEMLLEIRRILNFK